MKVLTHKSTRRGGFSLLEIIIAIAHTNEVPYGDPSSIVHSSGDEWFTYTFIARVLQNPARPAVRNWELH